MSTPFVSVILPTRNRAALLPRALASVLCQTFAEIELIVVDDGSTDGTAALVQGLADPRVVYLRLEDGGSDAKARNAGAARARGAWLAFQDSDDEWVPHKLACQARIARDAGPTVALVGSTLLRVTPQAVEPIAWPRRASPTEAAPVDRERFLAGFCAYLQSVLIRRSAFEAASGFDPALRARSDFDLCLRLLEHHDAVASPEVLAISFESTDGISGRADLRRDDIRHILRKHAAAIERNAAARGRYWYDLARAELACGERGAAARAALRALRAQPADARAWGLLAISPLGAGGLAAAASARRRLRPGSAR